MLSSSHKQTGHTDILCSLTKDAVKKGAIPANRNLDGLRDATFFFPLVLTGIDESMALYHTDQFGPIVPIWFLSQLFHANPLKIVHMTLSMK